MRPLISVFLIALMSWVQGRAAPGDPAPLQIKVMEGDGATYAPGSRATRGVVVVVTDENGRPVDGATVGFVLPMDGPGGEFVTGGRTAIMTTRADGKATIWGMRWNRIAGPLEIRVTAVKGQARGGITLMQYLVGDAASKSPSASGSGGGSHKWLWIVLAGAAAAGAGGFAALKGGSGSSASSSTSASASAVQIGTPSISLGRP
jgi:hypothetical protein